MLAFRFTLWICTHPHRQLLALISINEQQRLALPPLLGTHLQLHFLSSRLRSQWRKELPIWSQDYMSQRDWSTFWKCIVKWRPSVWSSKTMPWELLFPFAFGSYLAFWFTSMPFQWNSFTSYFYLFTCYSVVLKKYLLPLLLVSRHFSNPTERHSDSYKRLYNHSNRGGESMKLIRFHTGSSPFL